MNNYHFQSRVDRAFSQRIYLIDCKRPLNGEENNREENNDIFKRITTFNKFTFEIMGNSGTIYEITIPSTMENNKIHCSCPDHSSNGNLCKHLLFVLIRVLGLTRERVFTDYYQSDYKITQEVIDLSNVYMDKRDSLKVEGVDPNSNSQLDLNTKREVDEDDSCPICLEDFGKETLLWCKGQCGNSVHKSCFMKWVSKKQDAECIMCRAKWVW